MAKTMSTVTTVVMTEGKQGRQTILRGGGVKLKVQGRGSGVT